MKTLARFIAPLSLSLAPIFICTAPLAAANILLNPSFESGGIAPSPGPTEATTLTDGLPGFTDWDTVGPCEAGNCLLMVGTDYTENTLQFQANSGGRSVDLTGSGHSAFTGGISQTVNLAIGQLYQLTFFLGNIDEATSYASDSSLEVFINGISMGTFTNGAVTPNMVNWAQQSLIFTPTVGANTILFRDATPLSDHYAGLDDAFLDIVDTPEPSTFVLIGGSLCGLAAFRRKRG